MRKNICKEINKVSKAKVKYKNIRLKFNSSRSKFFDFQQVTSEIKKSFALLVIICDFDGFGDATIAEIRSTFAFNIGRDCSVN
jgi:hypothetical protein